MKYAVFLERDGVLNQARMGVRNQMPPLSVEDFHVNEDAALPLLELKAAGYLLLVITNQPGISNGYLSRRDMDFMHQTLRTRLPVDDILVCPHADADRCSCRKPKTGLMVEASFKWHLDLEHSFVVSDKWQDAAAAAVAGCSSILLQSPWIGSGHHDFVVGNLAQAAQKILSLQSLGQVAVPERCVA